MSKHLILVGLMGAGKTTVGAVCASRLGRPFVDTDDLVRASSGRTIDQIFKEYGEVTFREMEHEAVKQACGADEPSVIACGGGAVLLEDNRKIMRENSYVIWLTAPIQELATRAETLKRERPLLTNDPVATLEKINESRQALYEKVSDTAIDTFGKAVEQVADEVVTAYTGAEL